MMRRRDFISGFARASLMTSTAAVITAATVKGKQAAEKSIDTVSDQYRHLSSRIDKLEKSQKKVMKGMLFVMAVSTGIDLTLIV